MTAAWKDRPEIGSPLALRLIVRVAFGLGRSVARGVLYLGAFYFLLRRGPERRASRDFLTRALGRRAGLRDVYSHMLCFSHVVLDRVYLLTRRFASFDIRCFGLTDLDRGLQGGKGVLLIGAHLGSFEALRVLGLQRPEVPIRILLDQAQGPNVSRLLNALNPQLAATIIDTHRAGPTVSIAVKRALDDNAIVALLADRALPGEATREASFLGEPASFPVGPWLLAAALKVPVILSFGLYRGGRRYDLHFETFSECLSIERNQREERLSHILQRFADRLAHYVQLAPHNWFNFYAFWHKASGGDRMAGAASALRRA